MPPHNIDHFVLHMAQVGILYGEYSRGYCAERCIVWTKHIAHVSGRIVRAMLNQTYFGSTFCADNIHL